MQRRIIQEVSVEGAQRRKPSNCIVRLLNIHVLIVFFCKKRVMIIFIDTRLRADFSLFKVYSIKVAWSDGTINIVYRRYSEVLQLEVKTTCMDCCHYILCPEFSCFYCSSY